MEYVEWTNKQLFVNCNIFKFCCYWQMRCGICIELLKTYVTWYLSSVLTTLIRNSSYIRDVGVLRWGKEWKLRSHIWLKHFLEMNYITVEIWIPNNQDTGFPLTERDRLGLRGLLPPRVISFEQQYDRFSKFSNSVPLWSGWLIYLLLFFI